MPNVTKNRAVRWTAPVAAAVLAVALGLGGTVTASAEPPLPPRTAQELLVDLQTLQPRPLSGEVRQAIDLGLPDLPGFATPSLGDLSVGALVTLASGTHDWRVWTDGQEASRVSLIEASGESAVIRNGSDVWVWSSRDSSAVHSTLPEGSGRDDATPATSTPAEIADQVLQAIDPTTTVTTDRAERVAGRPAYQLVLTPKQDGTKVGSVRLAVDAETKVPLRVQVLTQDGTRAVDVAFTSVSFAAPDAGVFDFTPPPGATVTEQAGPSRTPTAGPPAAGTPTGPASAEPTVTGTGWTTVVVAESPQPTEAATAPSDRSAGALLDSLPQVSGSWGSGRLFDGTLVSVVLTDDGRVAAGAVAPEALYPALER